MRDDDANLPWQYMLLGLFIFGAIFAAPILLITFIPGEFHDRDLGWIRATTVIYLSTGLGATPWLLRNGRRRFGAINPDGRTLRGTLQQAPPHRSRRQRLVYSAVILAVGALASLASYSTAYSGDIYLVYIGFIGTGLIGIISALLAEEG